jgi:hypothetical protein
MSKSELHSYTKCENYTERKCYVVVLVEIIGGVCLGLTESEYGGRRGTEEQREEEVGQITVW